MRPSTPNRAVTEPGKPAKPGEAAWAGPASTTKPKESEEIRTVAARTLDRRPPQGLRRAHDRRTRRLQRAGHLACTVHRVSKNKQAAEITQVLREMGIEATDEAKASVVEDNPVHRRPAGAGPGDACTPTTGWHEVWRRSRRLRRNSW
jgi:hypothetical protein